MDFECSMCEWTTLVKITAAPHPHLKDFTINLILVTEFFLGPMILEVRWGK